MSDEQEQEWEPITDENYTAEDGVDQYRIRNHAGTWNSWKTFAIPHIVRVWAKNRPADSYQLRRPKRVAAVVAEPITDRGERYRRTIVESLPGPSEGKAITVDIADICEAFQLPYMLAQAAKKIMLPGERGSKDRLKDLREAAWHINRQIQIEEAKNNGPF